MSRLSVLGLGLVVCMGLGVGAQQAPPQPSPQPQPPQQQPPVFRGEVDLIRLDVSVLDKDRRPVVGLTADDFTVFEDGKLQRLVAVSEVHASENDQAPTAWMRHTPRDVASNDLTDQLAEGRAFAIVMDDYNTPSDDVDIIMSSREIARYIVDQMGPSDLAAVVFPQRSGNTQDFTDDRAKLLAAIDKFKPERVLFTEQTPQGTGQGGGDMPYRYSSALARTQCQRSQPTVPTIETLTAKLATVPNRRKTIVFVTTGVRLSFRSRDSCQSSLEATMLDVFRQSQRASINIYTIDPAGLGGYERYLQDPRRMMLPFGRVLSPEAARAEAKLVHDFMKTTADYTGARAIVNTGVWGEIDSMLAEAGSYYLLGYQTSNGKPDGKFRRIEVKIKRSGTTVRTRSGFYAPREGMLETEAQRRLPSANDLGLSGLMAPTMLPLRAVAVPVALVPGGKSAEVALLLTVRLPAPGGPINETVSIVRSIYDAESRPGPPSEEKMTLTLQPTTGDELRYDVQQRLTMAPGRYQIRLNATSTALGRSASIYADVEVPDFTRAAVSASAIVLGAKPAADAPRTDRLASVLPLIPTTARDFSPNEVVSAFLRIFEGGTSSVVPVTVTSRILDVADAVKFEQATTLAPESFDQTRGAPFEVVLPLAQLSRGPHVLSITSALPNGTSVRRDLVFRVR